MTPFQSFMMMVILECSLTYIFSNRTMKEVHESCENLLRECQTHTAYRSQSPLKQNSAMAHLRSKISTSKMLSQISPLEEEENNRIIDRMRSKYHRKQKETSIKKTDLGEDLLTFTPEEFQKLQFIDECQHKNIIYRDILDPITDEQNTQKMTAVERLKKMGRLDDILDQIRNNINWGQAAQGQQKKYYLRFKETKGFQKRNGQQNLTILKKVGREHKEDRKISGKHSLQKYFNTLLNKNTFNKNFLNSDPVYSWSPQQSTPLSFAEKVEIIRDQAARNLIKMTSSSSNLYMTQQRRNALYQCQVLRLSKKILGNKEFEKLQFSLSEKENEIQQEHLDENNVQKENKNCQAQQILQKNYQRIKEERKRVIEKLLC